MTDPTTRRAIVTVSAQWPAPKPWGPSPASSTTLVVTDTAFLAWPLDYRQLVAAMREVARRWKVPEDAGLVLLQLAWADPEPVAPPPPPKWPSSDLALAIFGVGCAMLGAIVGGLL